MRFSLVFVCLFMTWAPVMSQDSRSGTRKLVIATYTYADNNRIKNLEPLAAHIREVTNLKTEVKSYPTVQAMMAGMKKGEADLVFMNTFSYLASRDSMEYEPAAVLQLNQQQTQQYKTVIVTRATAPVSSLADVVQNASEFVLYLVNTGSTTGNLLPRLKLASMQPGFPERFFLEVIYTGSHQAARERAVSDPYAVCAFGKDEYVKMGSDTTLLKKLWESPFVPLGPVVMKKSLSSASKEELKTLLMNLHTENPEAFEMLKGGWTEFRAATQFGEIPVGYYDAVWKLSGNEAVSRYIVTYFAR